MALRWSDYSWTVAGSGSNRSFERRIVVAVFMLVLVTLLTLYVFTRL
jgi:hypothetical protein